VVSELTTAFQMGVMVLLPFLVVDLAVSTILMSMGMMMVSPMTLSLPIKLLLFVLADGWNLVVGSLLQSFR
jgi:flagellar biosynthetic protein FliP